MMYREEYNQRPIYLGVAGGIGTPQSASAFALGAYVITGSINQHVWSQAFMKNVRCWLSWFG